MYIYIYKYLPIYIHISICIVDILHVRRWAGPFSPFANGQLPFVSSSING